MLEEQGVTANPERMLALLLGFLGTGAIKAALDLEVFTLISHGAVTAEQLAAANKTSVRTMRILCDGLVGVGALNKRDGSYSLPPGAQALFVKGSPGYVGAMSRIFVNPVMWDAASKLTEAVKAGHATIEHLAEESDNPFWQEFSRATREMATMLGPILANAVAEIFVSGGPKRILDIAAGSGMYGFSALQRFSDARLVSVDWPGVLKLAEPTARQLGLSDRVEFRPGDIFSVDLGSGYDLLLAVNIYHHFGLDKCTELSRRLYDATAPGGVLVVVDTLPDEKREEDRNALTFALLMLMWTHEGDYYTLSEYRQALEAAAYRDIELRQIAGLRPMRAVIARK